MPSRTDLIQAINDLVNAVYDYSWVDQQWDHLETEEARRGRLKMEGAAQRVMVFSGQTASREELDQMFDWER